MQDPVPEKIFEELRIAADDSVVDDMQRKMGELSMLAVKDSLDETLGQLYVSMYELLVARRKFLTALANARATIEQKVTETAEREGVYGALEAACYIIAML